MVKISVRSGCNISHSHRAAILEFDNFERKPPVDPRGAGKECFHRLKNPFLHTKRACDQKRFASLEQELRRNEEKRNPAAVVSMQMGNENCVYVVRIYAIPVHADQGRCAAIDKELAAAVSNENAALESAAASEGVTAAEEFDFYFTHDIATIMKVASLAS